MSDRRYQDAPTLAPAIRAQMTDAVYTKLYANALPRASFDKQFADVSDLDLANTTYDVFFKAKMPRPEFNKSVGMASASGSTLGAVTSGMTFGLTDEVSGAVSGAASALRGRGFSEGYDSTTKGMRQNAEVFRQNNPYLGRGIEFAGGLLGGGMASGAAASAPSLGLLQLMGRGAAMGAVGGAGDAEGGVESRAKGAALGAGIGAALPPAITGGAHGASRIGTLGANLLGIGSPVPRAERIVAGAMSKSGVSPEDARVALGRFPENKPAVLADVGGQNSQQLGAVIANRPGAGAQMADDLVSHRIENAPDRLAGDFNRLIAPGSGNAILNTRQGLQAQRTADAAPLYEQAFAKPFGMTDEVQHFLKSPEALTGLARGRNIQRVENSARQLRGEAPHPMTDPAIKFADDGTPQIVGQPNMRSLDSIKRGLDAMLEVYRQPNGRLQLDEHGRAIEQVRKAFLAQLDVGSDPYKQARAAWAGPSEALEAMRFGRDVPRLDRDVVAQRVGDMTPGVRDFMRIGASRAYTDAAADPARAPGVVRNMTRNRTTQAKLDTIIDDPARRAGLDRAMAAERAMQDTNAVINPRANSQTGRLAAGQELIEDTKPTMLSKALRRKADGQNPVWGLVRDLGARASVGPQGVTDHAGSLLFNRNRPEVMGLLKMLESRMVDDAMRDQQKSQLMRLMMGSGAAAFSQQIQ